MDRRSIQRVVSSDISLLFNNGKRILMKSPLVLTATLLLSFSSSVFSQSNSSDIIQPLMACLKSAVPTEKSKATPKAQNIKHACSSELQALSALSPNVRARLMADMNSGLAKHLKDKPKLKEKPKLKPDKPK